MQKNILLPIPLFFIPVVLSLFIFQCTHSTGHEDTVTITTIVTGFQNHHILTMFDDHTIINQNQVTDSITSTFSSSIGEHEYIIAIDDMVSNMSIYADSNGTIVSQPHFEVGGLFTSGNGGIRFLPE